MMGAEGIRAASETAILSANYVATRLAPCFPVLYSGAGGRVAHECIIDTRPLNERAGVTVDDIAKRLLGPRMCISGLIEQKDISGLDTHALAQQSIVPHLCHDPQPSAVLQQLYAAGHVGLKSGKGFYDWGDSDPLKVKADAARKVERIMSLLAEMNAADKNRPE